MAEYVLGFDLGATNVRGHFFRAESSANETRLVDLFGERRRTLGGSLAVFRELAAELARDAAAWLAEHDIPATALAFGVAAPGPMNTDEGWISAERFEPDRSFLRNRVAVWIDAGVQGRFENLARRDLLTQALSEYLNDAGRRHPFDDVSDAVMRDAARALDVRPDDVTDILRAIRARPCAFDNDVNMQAFWIANLPRFRRFERCFVANPGSGYGGGLTIHPHASALAVPAEAIEVGILNDFGARYGFADGQITAALADADDVFDGRPAVERLWKGSRSSEREYARPHHIETLVSGPGLANVFFGVIEADPDEYAPITNAPVEARGALIAQRAREGDPLARRALEIVAYHLGMSFYRVDCLENVDAFVWIGNTAEQNADLMRDAVIEGYAACCAEIETGRRAIREKLHIIDGDAASGETTQDAEETHAPYEHVGAKGAALAATTRGMEALRRPVRRATRIVFDTRTLAAAYRDEAGSRPIFRPVNIGALPFAGVDASDRSEAGRCASRSYADAARTGDTALRWRVAGLALADLMTWTFTDDVREVVLLDLPSGDARQEAFAAIRAACMDGHELGRPGQQFDRVRWMDEERNPLVDGS